MSRLFIPGAFAVALWGVSSAHALAPRQPDAAKLVRDIDRLSTVGHVLYIAAHPDDENTRLLAWLVQTKQVRAAYLSLTRGEGGQNLIGSEQAPLLGLIRTQELLGARSIDGAEQLFGNERDFGFSKTPEETLAIWGKPEALGDVVWAIRRFQPDVIVTRFSPEDRQTHGHHTASAMLALEAFHAAADPKAYPEQLKWVAPWQARRIVWNKGVFGPAKPGSLEGFVPLDVGGYDPLLGDSAGEIAARSRSMHKSQGFGSTPQRGPSMEYFRVLAGEPIQGSFLDGVDLTWARVPGSEHLREILTRVRSQFDMTHPATSIPALLEAADAIDALPDNTWKAEKHAEVTSLIAACAGLHLDATAADPTAIPGGEVKVKLTAINRSDSKWVLHSVALLGSETPVDKPLENNEPLSLDQTVTLPSTTPVSNPYWLVDEPSAGRWTVRDQPLVGLPELPAALQAELHFTVNAHPLTITQPVSYTWNDPVAGERRRPLEVLPPATFNTREPLLMFPDGAQKQLQVTVHATRGAVSGTLTPVAPKGFTVQPASRPFKIAEAGSEQVLGFEVRPPAHLNSESASETGMLKLAGQLDGGGVLDRGVRRVEYPHIPIQTLAPLAEVKLVRFTMKRALTRIGYIPGAGDEVPAALRQVGYDVTMLNDEALAKEPLGTYQAIVVGVRAFNVNDRLPRYHQKLMDYVAAGGTLIAQYNTQNRISQIVGQIGPWPFNISHDRVTDERATMNLLAPKHAVFNSPNKIVASDFADWVQERGIYFADKWDEHYVPLISMNDPGEQPKEGSLLVARSGKGIFVYTGLVFFRELPAGVPGAFRLFANLLSHGH